MAITGNQKALMYAIGGVARGGATRGGYTSGQIFILEDGVHVGHGRAPGQPGVVIESLSITDSLDETANRCSYRAFGRVPTPGSELVLTLGSKNNLERMFAGSILTVDQTYAANNPQHTQADVAAIDYTWSLGFRKVTKRYLTLSASAIVADVIATYAIGFTGRGIVAGLPVLDEITFTNEDLTAAITRVARRIGAYWYVDYHRDVHFFLSEVRNGAPVPLTVDHKSLAHFASQADRSQTITRVYVEGRGTKTLGPVLAGDTMIPIEAADMFAPFASDLFLKISRQGAAGGAQLVNYTGVDLGGFGSLVGPGAGPPGAPALAPALGAGLFAGLYQYAYTFLTAAGESLPSPIAAITVGALLAPPTGVVALTVEAFVGGVARGWIWYWYTFASASGETTGSDGNYVETVVAMATPAQAPTLVPAVGAGLASGVYKYAYTFASASGETLPSPIATVTPGQLIPPPATPMSSYLLALSNNGVTGDHYYTYTFVSASGETTGPAGMLVGARLPITPTGGIGGVNDYLGGNFPPSSIRTYAATYVGTAGGETTQAQYVWNAVAGGFAGGHMFEIFVGGFEGQGKPQYNIPPGVAAVNIYRSAEGAYNGPYYFVATANVTNRYPDGSVSSASFMDIGYTLGAPMPTSNAAYANAGRVTLQGITTGPAGIVARHIYRTEATGVRRIGTISNNVTTTFEDINPPTDTGALLPTVNTAGDEYRRVALSTIAVGGVGVTARKIYRTTVNGSQLKLLTTWADNTTTTGLDATSDAALGANAPTTAIPTDAGKVTISGVATGGPGTVARKIYRSRQSDGSMRYVATINNNTATTYVDTLPDASLGAVMPDANTAGDEYRQVQLSNIAAGPSVVTARRLYRSTVGGAQLKFLVAVGDNTTPTYLDAIADAALGANMPTGDTSGITQITGQVPAGSASVVVANAAAFRSGGGWAVIGNGEQVIRYTGRTASALTGVPATGVGAIVAAVAYNSTITGAPMVIGVPASGVAAIVSALTEGDELYLVVFVTDNARAAALAADMGVGNGIREEWIQDRRLSIIEARARANATLAIHPLDERAVAYTCRDLRTSSGKTITVALGAPTNVSGDFKIQEVTITNFRPHANQYPTFTVKASNRLFTFEDFLRRIETTE